MSSDGLDALFAPRAIAVVGASSKPGKLGSAMFWSLLGGDTPVVGVNAGHPDPDNGLFASLDAAADAASDRLDLVVSCVPAAATASVVDDAAACGARGVLVCAGGFAETGDAGLEHHEALVDAVARTGVRLLGPNTSGFIVPHRGLTASFVPGARALRPGGIAIVAASGGMNHALAFGLSDLGAGVRIGVGLGNGVDVTQADVLEHLLGDEGLTAVGLHVESVPEGRRLLRAVRALVPEVPVVALVLGRSDVGDFARSHTGALATSWRTMRSGLAQAGAVLVDDDRALLDAVHALSRRRLPANRDPRIGIVTAQAGPGLLLADGARSNGIAVPELGEATVSALGELLPPMTYQRNPVDTGRPGPEFADVVRTVGRDPAIDGVLLYALLEPTTFDLSAVLVELGDELPLIVATTGVPENLDELVDSPAGDRTAIYRSTAAAVSGLRAWVADSRARASLQADKTPTEGTPLSLPDELDEHAAKALLDGLRVPTPRRRVVDDDAAAHAALDEFGTVVAKILDAEVVHKSDIGGVHVGIRDHDQLDQALETLRSIGARRVLIEQQAPAGPELLVGVRRDPVFGTVVALGLGGTVAELLEQVVLRVAPLSASQAATMLDELPGRELFDGWRGGPHLDRSALVEALVALTAAVDATPQVEDLEINPVRVLPDGGIMALDAVILRAPVSGAPPHHRTGVQA